MIKILKEVVCAMTTNSKLVIGVGLVALALAFFLTNAIGGLALLRTAGPGLAPVLGIGEIVPQQERLLCRGSKDHFLWRDCWL